MKRILLLGLNVWLSSLMISCATTPQWEWKADPYEPNISQMEVVSGTGKTVKCYEAEFSGFTCFPYQNIEALKVEIKKMKLYNERSLLDFLKE